MALLGGDAGQRRRRVLTEQMLAATPASRDVPAADAAEAEPRGARYAEETFTAQPSLVSFVATRYATLALWLMLAALVVVGLESAYVHLPDLEKIADREALAAFDLAVRGNLGDWYGSLLLALAGVGSLAIYSIRRHKIDDYSGRYRIWLWAACGWLVLSAASTAPFHLVIPPIAVKMSGFLGWAGGAWWWLAPALMFYGALGMRLAIDLRECKLALAALLLAFGCWAAALVVRLGGLSLEAEMATVVRTSAVMAGQVLLLTALGLYARFNVLDARGLLPTRTAKAKAPREKKPGWRERRAAAKAARAAKAEEKAAAKAAAAEAKANAKAAAAEAKRAAKAETAAKNLKVDAAHASPPPPVSRPARNDDEDDDRSAPYASDDYESDDSDEDWDEDGNSSSRKLTKAERRRLRKQGRQGRA